MGLKKSAAQKVFAVSPVRPLVFARWFYLAYRVNPALPVFSVFCYKIAAYRVHAINPVRRPIRVRPLKHIQATFIRRE